MQDGRLFRVVRVERVKKEQTRLDTLPVARARELATKERALGHRTYLVNDETGAWFKWWPELG